MTRLPYGYDHTTGDGQKKLMYESAGLPYIAGIVRRVPGKDYGSDPIGNGQFRMVPSGDIVDTTERNKRLN